MATSAAARPVPSTEFTVTQAALSDLLYVWTLLQTFARPLGLYPFSFDDFECALRYNHDDCGLVYEVHASMLRLVVGDQRSDHDSDIDAVPARAGAFQPWSGDDVSRDNWISILQTGITPVRAGGDGGGGCRAARNHR